MLGRFSGAFGSPCCWKSERLECADLQIRDKTTWTFWLGTYISDTALNPGVFQHTLAVPRNVDTLASFGTQSPNFIVCNTCRDSLHCTVKLLFTENEGFDFGIDNTKPTSNGYVLGPHGTFGGR